MWASNSGAKNFGSGMHAYACVGHRMEGPYNANPKTHALAAGAWAFEVGVQVFFGVYVTKWFSSLHKL